MKYYNPNTHDSFIMQFGFSYPKWKPKKQYAAITVLPYRFNRYEHK